MQYYNVEINKQTVLVPEPCLVDIQLSDIENNKFNLDKWSARTGRKDVKIYLIKKRLNELSADFLQVTVGAKIADIDERIKEFQKLHNELRALEGKAARVYGE